MSFPRYPKYKDSGVEWLGEVPGHWEVCALRRIVSMQSGESITGETIEESGDFPVFGGNGLRGYTTDFTHDGHYVLIGRQGALCGNVNYASGKFWASEHAVVVTPVKQLATVWLGEMLRAMNLNQYSVAAAQPGLSVDLVGRIDICVPPLPEQTQIASFLDRETAKIDALVAEQRRLMELLKCELNSLVLSAAALESTKQIRLTHAADVVSRPVIQREGELYTPIGLFNRGRGLFHKDPREMADMGDSDFFWIEDGDLIISGQFAWEGSVALADKEEAGCVVSHRYPVLRGKNDVALTEYLFALLCTGHGDFLLNESSWGAAGRNRPLNINLLLKEKIPVPTMETQIKVARAVRKRKKLVEEIARQTSLLQERRTALISAAVTGQIDVRGEAVIPAPDAAFA